MRISVVTPSFNQAGFIERTIESVLSQRGDFELEYVVIDGGSTDGTLDILRRHGGLLSFVSEKDDGQSDALNKGFRRAGGDVLCWLNSDDTFEPGALARVAATFRSPGFRWAFGQCRIVDEQDREVRRAITWYKNALGRRYSFSRLLVENFVPQPATFFTRALWDRCGPLEKSFWYSMDYDLWLKLGRVAEPCFIPAYLAAFRWHGASKSGARYREGSWEAFQTACRHARPGEIASIARHWAHHVGLVTVYGLLDTAADLGRPPHRAKRETA